MIETVEAPNSGYRFMPGVSQYSCGVGALPGFAIERVRFSEPVPLKAGFARIAEIIKAGRPAADGLRRLRVALARALHRGRLQGLQRDLHQDPDRMGHHEGRRQSGRAQQCLSGDRSARGAGLPCLHLHRTSAPDAAPSFVVAGSGESLEGKANYRDHTVRLGDTSPEGMLEKAKFVLGEMERRMSAFGGNWRDTTGVQLYTVHDIYPFLDSELGRRGAAASRPDLAFQPAPGGRPRIRDGLPQRPHRARDLARSAAEPAGRMTRPAD